MTFAVGLPGALLFGYIAVRLKASRRDFEPIGVKNSNP